MKPTTASRVRIGEDERGRVVCGHDERHARSRRHRDGWRVHEVRARDPARVVEARPPQHVPRVVQERSREGQDDGVEVDEPVLDQRGVHTRAPVARYERQQRDRVSTFGGVARWKRGQ
jgi:hypothetical protein